jgi:bleomycin hydrolase
MKLALFGIFVSAFISVSTAQESNDQITNAEGSEYRFTQLAHLDATPVQSQGWTGTCWSFSGLSFFESELIRMGNKEPEVLSQMWVARKAYEAKAEKYIRMGGKTNFDEGGELHDIPYVIKRYGIVPLSVYSGKVYEGNRHNHSELYSVLNGAMQGLLSHLENSSTETLTSSWIKAISGILDAYFGENIETFDYKGKEYTPKSYAKSLGLDMDNYLSLTSFTNHPMNEECIIAIQDNWSWGSSYNVPLNDMVEATIYALKNGYTVGWAADVSEAGFNFRKGIAINPTDANTINIRGRDNKNFSDAGADKVSDAFMTPVEEVDVTAELRQVGYDNKSTTDDHAMHIVGLYKDQNGTNYFLVKNSWGTGNYPEGYLYVSESYFKWKTLMVYLHKDGLSKGMNKQLGL